MTTHEDQNQNETHISKAIADPKINFGMLFMVFSNAMYASESSIVCNERLSRWLCDERYVDTL